MTNFWNRVYDNKKERPMNKMYSVWEDYLKFKNDKKRD